MNVLYVLLGVSLLGNVVLGQLVVRAARRLLGFDDLVNYLVDDMETNISYFDKLSNTPVLSNVPEIVDASKNMNVMSKRLDEFLNRFEEMAGRTIRNKTKSKPLVPLV